MANLGFQEILLIGVIIIIFFGAKKIPEMTILKLYLEIFSIF